ncbi:MAG: spore coat protein U domain-containing protein, partial [Deltaproteobacteria bacterium]|jgi:spore coat protein U-like protein|nr:spore coat protein U domain-containing protein [Deltaproteobacteria bacterium]
VVNKCKITGVTDVAFGNYDPTEDTTPTDATGSVTMRCTKNSTFETYISGGAGVREMIDGTNLLPFELYYDSAGGTVYPNTTPGYDPFGGAGTTDNSEFTINIYGRIPVLQDVPAGTYSKDLTFTVDY